MHDFLMKHSISGLEVLRDLALTVTMFGQTLRLDGGSKAAAVALQDDDELLSRLSLFVACLGSGRGLTYARDQIGRYPGADRFFALVDDANPLCVNRRLFVTAAGVIGLGPQTMSGQKSECLAVPTGSRYPYILRSQGSIAAGLDAGYRPLLSLRYQLVGHCYVRSMVTGELTWEKHGRIFEII